VRVRGEKQNHKTESHVVKKVGGSRGEDRSDSQTAHTASLGQSQYPRSRRIRHEDHRDTSCAVRGKSGVKKSGGLNNSRAKKSNGTRKVQGKASEEITLEQAFGVSIQSHGAQGSVPVGRGQWGPARLNNNGSDQERRPGPKNQYCRQLRKKPM